jgi:hypothetical protein
MNTMNGVRRVSTSIVFLVVATPFAGAQNRLNLATQTKDVDFSGAPSTKPAQVGTAIPTLCSTGQVFFDLSAPAGQNLYGCTATNTWSLLGGSGGGGAGLASQLGDFSASNTSASTQTLGGCSTVTPCQIRTGTTLLTVTAPLVLSIGGTVTSGTVYWYLSSSQILTAGHNTAATLGCAGGCSVVTGITAFPPDSIPLWQTTFTANVWDPINLVTMDKRAVYSRNVIAAGSGIMSASDPSTGIQTLTTDPTQVPRYFTGSGAPTGSCTPGRDLYTDTTGLNLYFCDTTNTWKQANGGSTAVSAPYWPFGRSTVGSATSALSAANKVVTWLFSVASPRTFSSGVSLWYLTDGAHTAFAIYDINGNLITSTATRAGSGANTQATLSWSNSFTLQPGDYYFAFTSDTTAARMFEISDALGGMATIDNNSGTVVYGICTNSSAGTTTLTFPSTCGTQTAQPNAEASDPPYMIFK